MRVYQGAPGTGSGILWTATLEVVEFTFVIVNTTGSPATVTANLYAAGGAVATDNQILPAASAAANSVATVNFPLALTRGDVIEALQGTSGAINVFIDVVTKL